MIYTYEWNKGEPKSFFNLKPEKAASLRMSAKNSSYYDFIIEFNNVNRAFCYLTSAVGDNLLFWNDSLDKNGYLDSKPEYHKEFNVGVADIYIRLLEEELQPEIIKIMVEDGIISKKEFNQNIWFPFIDKVVKQIKEYMIEKEYMLKYPLKEGGAYEGRLELYKLSTCIGTVIGDSSEIEYARKIYLDKEKGELKLR
ncbi:MAG: hypothetical protein ACRCZ9_10375 [Fusobacteriaceae bacterium]